MKIKRGISLILALAMALSLLPTVSLASDERTTLEYEFSYTSVGESKQFAPKSGESDKYKNTNWEFIQTINQYNKYLLPNGYMTRMKTNQIGKTAVSVFKLKSVENGGAYIPKFTWQPNLYGTELSLYLADASSIASGSFDLTVETDIESAIDKINNGDIGFKLGSIDTLKAMDASTVGYNGIWIESFTFEDAESKALNAVSLNANEDYYLFVVSSSYDSSKTGEVFNHVLVDDKNNNFVYGIYRGISFIPYADDATNDITGISVSPSSIDLGLDEKYKLSAEIEREVTGAETTAGLVTYSSSDSSVVSVNASTGELTAESEGTATVTATVTGTEIKDTVAVTVLGEDTGNGGKKLEYIFNTSVVVDPTSDNTIKSGEASNIDEFADIKSPSAPWAFVSHNGYNWNMGGSNFYANARMDSASYKANQPITAFKIKISNKGEYRVSADVKKVIYGTRADVYIIPENELEKIDRASIEDKTPVGEVDFYSAGESFENVKIGNVNIDGRGSHYLLFVWDSDNENLYSERYHQLFLEKLTLSAAPGELSRVDYEIDGVPSHAGEDSVSGIMPRLTEKKLNIKLYDAYGIEIDEGYTISNYASSDEAVAEISDSGVISASLSGQATITADAEYKGVKKTITYNLTVADKGENLMANLNPGFETDDWYWASWKNEQEPAPDKFARMAIVTEPTAENENNRALAMILEGNVAAGSRPSPLALKSGANLIPIKSGNFYQLKVKIKADYEVPDDASDMDMFLDVFTYDNASASSAAESTSGVDTGRSMNLITLEVDGKDWRKLCEDWYEVTLPVPAPTESPCDTLYITPRFAIRPGSDNDLAAAGYKGTIWFDDFELCEVGYEGIDVEVTGDLDTGARADVTIISKPYSTWRKADGTKAYLSLWDEMSVDGIAVSSSDEYVIGSLRAPEIALYGTESGTYFANVSAKTMGKNAKAKITSKIELNGITREGTLDASVSGFAKALLYAEASVEPASVNLGENARVNITGYLSDGTPVDIANTAGAVVTYKSLTPEIVSVDSAGNVAALAGGTGKIQVSMFLDNAGAEAVAEVKVVDNSPIAEAWLAGPETVGHLRDEQLTVTGITENRSAADISSAAIEWIVSPENAVTIENMRVYGKTADASAEIYARVTLNGKTVETNKITVTVGESDMRDFLIDFRTASQDKPRYVTIEEDGWEINTEKTTGYVVKNSTFNTMGLLGAVRDTNEKLVLNVDIPYTGYYQIILTGTYYSYNAMMGDVYVDGTYVGDYDYYNGTNAPAEPEALRTVYLEKGVHEFTFQPTEKGPRRAYQTVKELRFRNVSSLPEAKSVITDSEEYYLAFGETVSLGAALVTSDGFAYGGQKQLDNAADSYAELTYSVDDKTIATVADGVVIAGSKAGESTVTVSGRLLPDGEVFTKNVKIIVSENGASVDVGDIETLEITGVSFLMNPDSRGVSLGVVGITPEGKRLELESSDVIWTSEDSGIIAVDESGFASPVALGEAVITAELKADPEKTATALLAVREGKTSRTYYTDEKVSAARENISKYSWAKSEKDTAVAAADKYLGLEEAIWKLIPGEGIPRGYGIGYRQDPNRATCRYCGADLKETHNTEVMASDPVNRPWKVQCQECKRTFPSNDFESFYERGLDEHRVFDYTRALEENGILCGRGYRDEESGKYIVKDEYKDNPYGYGDPKGNLYNETYSELYTSQKDPLTGDKITHGWGSFTVENSGYLWGVDDGFGYKTGRKVDDVDEVHTYIANYNYGIWYGGIIQSAVNELRDAYIYTGDAKYGRIGAIIVDRIADVYPGYDLTPYLPEFANGDGSSSMGKIIGRIHETILIQDFSRAYDAFFPMFNDASVISFLSDKAKELKLESKLTATDGGTYEATGETLRRNVEDNLLREGYKAAWRGVAYGNFGFHQTAVGFTAIVLDNHPETDEMFEWIEKYSVYDKNLWDVENGVVNTGGGVNERLVERVSRDGQGNESAPGYNRIWVTELSELANAIAEYEDYSGGLNLYENPKYIAMIASYAPFTLVRRGVPSIGDSGMAGSYSPQPDEEHVLVNGFKYLHDSEDEHALAAARTIAQHLYFQKGGDLSEVHYDIFTRAPETLADQVEAVINEYGEYDYDKSTMMSGYGLGVLREGTLYESVGTNVIRDTTRDFWMYFGGSVSHNHEDKLNLGIESYGIGMTSDLGYPEATGNDENRIQWQNATISHNTVVVNEQSQLKSEYPHKPLHFDAKDTRVKVMDVDAAGAYTATDDYRRTVVMVDYDSEVSYGIDFFRILGGEDHLYSFHASSDEDPKTSSNLSFETQPAGTYAGVSVPFGPDPYGSQSSSYNILKYPSGYTWLYDVKRADNPTENSFYVDFKIKDFRKLSRNNATDMRLRMTMVNDWIPDEVSLANGMPPRKPSNTNFISHYEYMLVRRTGRDLDTLFTTVIEPYNKERYIKEDGIKRVEATPDKATNAPVAAVKVELVDGRCDYIVYSQDNTVTYTVTDPDTGYSFDFRGFVGVWTVNKDNVNIYSYVNDGEMIGTADEKVENLNAAITGTITDAQTELSFDNWVTVKLDQTLSEEEMLSLADCMMNVERKALGNSSFVIKSVEVLGEDEAKLNFGNTTLIRKYADSTDIDSGYVYDAAKGMSFEIPMSYESNPAPVIDPVSDMTVSAGSTIKTTVKATSKDGGITYSARQLPRGASFDAKTASFSWKPDSSQIGDNLVAVDATDSLGRTSTVYFTITVYGSTTGSAGTTESTGTSGEGTSSGGGGGGGGGTTDSSASENTDTSDKTDTETTQPDASGETDNIRFTDLGNHAWAADAINSLAADGIVKGTTATTYSPGANITRADFALLLVRAFNLTSDNAENFADVSADDYFAPELAVARNTGIINGIGDNKYAPRNPITRQDMMVIVYRAIKPSLPKGGGTAEWRWEDSPASVRPSDDEQEPSPVGEGGPLAVDEALLSERYGDWDTVAPYARDAVSYLITNGIVNGKSGLIAPTDYTTRAEVAVLLKRILEYISQ